MTKLQAVNYVLMQAGGLPVAAIDNGGASPASMAERFLDQEEFEIQTQGWHYNTRLDVEIDPDGSAYVNTPAGVLKIDSYGEDGSIDVAQVGSRLFDRDNNTFEFTSGLKTKYAIRFEWGCIPLPIRQYIAASAAVKFNQQWGKPTLTPSLRAELYRLRLLAKKFDCDTAGRNLLDTTEARDVRGDRSQSKVMR